MQLDDNGLITLDRKAILKPRPLPVCSAIYMIVNTVNDKYYIGSAVDVRNRITYHLSRLNRNIHHNQHLQKAWNKYGKEAFVYLILEKVSKENLEVKEQAWMDRLKANDPEIGYNIRKQANSNQGYKHTEEAKEKVRASKIGKPRSEETKEKLRQANLGKKQSLETAQKRSASMKGRVYSAEHRANMSTSMKGIKRTEEGKQNIAKAAKGRKASEETKAKMSEAAKLRWQNYNAIK